MRRRTRSTEMRRTPPIETTMTIQYFEPGRLAHLSRKTIMSRTPATASGAPGRENSGTPGMIVVRVNPLIGPLSRDFAALFGGRKSSAGLHPCLWRRLVAARGRRSRAGRPRNPCMDASSSRSRCLPPTDRIARSDQRPDHIDAERARIQFTRVVAPTRVSGHGLRCERRAPPGRG